MFAFADSIPDFFSVDAAATQTVCKTDTIQLSGTIISSLNNAYTGSFQWLGGGGTFIPNDSTLAARYIPSSLEMANDSAKLFLQLRYNCSNTKDSVTIHLMDTVVANAGADQNVCSNSTSLNATIPASGAGIWSLISGATNITSPDSANSVITNNAYCRKIEVYCYFIKCISTNSIAYRPS